jgi:hypothetical protein
MHEYLEERRIACPYCAAPVVIVIDRSAGEQDYIEDCQVCCRPLIIGVRLDAAGGIREITTRREDE